MNENAVNALASYRAKVASGKIDGTRERLNPKEKALANPQSRSLAIDAHCYECMGMESDWRTYVKDCTSPSCSLFRFRPFKKEGEE